MTPGGKEKAINHWDFTLKVRFLIRFCRFLQNVAAAATELHLKFYFKIRENRSNMREVH